jgi:hypothetical protein
MRARSWWICAALALAVPAVGGAVPRGPRGVQAQRAAQQPAAGTQIEVLVIDASTGDAGVDRGLSALSQLRRAPFSMFSTMRLVSRSTLPLACAGEPVFTVRSSRADRAMILGFIVR